MVNHLKNTPELRTERLVLRKFTWEDLQAFFDIHADEAVNVFLPWFPLRSMEEAEAFFEERYETEYKKERACRYAICLQHSNIPLGYANVSTDDSHDLGFGLKKEFWGKGIMAEACEAVLEQVEEDGFRYVTATHDINNTRSGQVMKKLGMQYKYSYGEHWQPKDLMLTFRMYQLNFDGDQDRLFEKYWNLHPFHFIEDLE